MPDRARPAARLLSQLYSFDRGLAKTYCAQLGPCGEVKLIAKFSLLGRVRLGSNCAWEQWARRCPKGMFLRMQVVGAGQLQFTLRGYAQQRRMVWLVHVLPARA